jgi:hypothetical protein
MALRSAMTVFGSGAPHGGDQQQAG